MEVDWNLCVICGGGGTDLKCPADSHQKNGLEVYTTFLDVLEEFRELEALPVHMDYKGDNIPQLFLQNRAKWHKSCYLKFTPSKLQRAREQRSKKRERSFSEQNNEQRRSKRRVIDEESCIFCLQVSGKLHQCSTMGLDQELRKMATDLQDTSLLARFSGGDLVAIEGKYHYKCLSDYKNRHRSHVRASYDCSSKVEDRHLLGRAFAELVCYIESSVVNGTYIFKLS